MGNLPQGFFEPTDEALGRADEMVAEFDGALDGRLKAWFSIRVPVACSDDLLRRLGQLAEKRGVGIIGHACENRDETVASHLKYGMGDIARLEKLGLLGPKVLLLHMGWVDPKEMHMLQKRDVKISLAPSASMHQAMGNISHGKTPEMLEMGLALSLDRIQQCRAIISMPFDRRSSLSAGCMRLALIRKCCAPKLRWRC